LLTPALSQLAEHSVEQRKNVIKHMVLPDSAPDRCPQFIGPCQQQQPYCR
jgi:hypothetical protein